MAEDGRVGKVLVVGPAGMATEFWRDVERGDISDMNDPTKVAEATMDLWQDDFRYQFAKILRARFVWKLRKKDKPNLIY